MEKEKLESTEGGASDVVVVSTVDLPIYGFAS